MTLLSEESLEEDPLVTLLELELDVLESLDSLLLSLLSLSLLVVISSVLQLASIGG